MPRIFLTCVLVGLLLISAQGFGPVLSLSEGKVRWGTPVKLQPLYDLLLVTAQEKGFWKEQGLEVEWTAFEAGATLRRAVSAGAIDMGISATTSTVFGIASRPEEIIVGELGSREDYVIYVRSDSPIKGPQDFKGMRVGVTRLGGLYHIYSQAIAKKLGIEMKYQGIGGHHAQLAAVKGGLIDAILISKAGASPMLLKKEIRPVALVRDYLPPEWSDQVFYARRDYVDKSPDSITKGIKAAFRAADYLLKNRAWAVQRIKSLYGFSEEDASWVFDNTLNYGQDGKISPKALENVLNFQVEYGIIPKDKVPPLQLLFTTRFTE